VTHLLDELRAKWNEALRSGSSGREWRAIALGKTGPVKILAGVRDRDDRPSLLIESAMQYAPKHRVRFQAEGISVADSRVNDEGLARIAITLERSDLHGVFEVLAVDLAAVALNSTSPDTSIRKLLSRLEAWQACLRARQHGLTFEEQLGLFGELLFLEQIATKVGFPCAVGAWSVDGLHDFTAAGMSIELKTTVGAQHIIKISHVDQLDTKGIDALVLARLRLVESPEGTTLGELVRRMRAKLSSDSPTAAEDFGEKLMRSGFLDSDADVYALRRFKLQEIFGYLVSGDFPCLTRSNTPTAVTDAVYSLDEAQLVPFRLDNDQFEESFCKLGMHDE
jgi:hypothetical protein